MPKSRKDDHRWSAEVAEHSDALDLRKDVFTLHPRELRVADETSRLRSERAIDEDVVRCAQKLFERDQLNSKLSGALGGGIRIEGEEAPDVESAQESNGFRCNVAHADGADYAIARLAAKRARALCPAPLADLSILDG